MTADESNGGRVTGYIVGTLVLVGIWWAASLLLDVPALPPPPTAFQALITGLKGPLLAHTWASARRVILSLLWATIVGTPAGIVLGRSAWAHRFLAPFVYLIYPVPKIVFLPVVIALLHSNDTSKVFLIGFIIFFQVLVTTRDAARAISRQIVLSVESLGGGRKDLWVHVYLPAVFPSVLTALRLGVGTAIAVLFFAETFITRLGLGTFLIEAWSRLDFADMYAGIIAMGTLGLLLYFAIDQLERRICRWQQL
jgi:NitT/TauT family transport system permease protein